VYWNAKIAPSRAGTRATSASLIQQGWDVLELWVCEVRQAQSLEVHMRLFMQR